MNCSDGSTGSASATRPQNATGGRSLKAARWTQNSVAAIAMAARTIGGSTA